MGDKGFLHMDKKLPPSKSNSRTSILSRRSSGRVTPEDSLLVNIHYNSALEIRNADSGDDLSPSSRISSIEVNPLYESKRRKSSLLKLEKSHISSSNNSLDNSPIRTRKYHHTGMDEADGTYITKAEFLNKWKSKPEMIIEPYNIDTEENVMHFLAREGKLDVLKELCNSDISKKFVVEALKAQDKFGQTPMLSSINSSDNR